MIDLRAPDYANTPVSLQRPVYTYTASGLFLAPIVTVITRFDPATSELFLETAASLFRQSLQNWQWIVLGRGSAGLDPDGRIQILADEAPTVRESVYRAVPLARAPFVALLESGNLLEPTALEKLSWFLDRHPQYAFVRGYEVLFGRPNGLRREEWSNTVPVSSIFRKEVLLELAGAAHEDFWQRCADRSFWGGTIPEFLGWRRGDRTESVGTQNIQTPAVWKNGIPPARQLAEIAPAIVNPLAKPGDKKRLLLLAPHLEIGGADKFNLDLIASLQKDHAYEVTVVTTLSGTHSLRHEFEHLTPDVFTLNTFLPVQDYPRFISELIRSRGPDTVLIANNKLGYELLPMLRTGSEGPSFVDYLHMEDAEPNGYPQHSLRYAAFLDQTIVSSEHLKQWLTERSGAVAPGSRKQIDVCTTSVDPDLWDRSRYDAASVRAKYGLPEGVPVVVYAARLCRQKQPEVLARVIQAVRDRGMRFVCLVAGDGEYRHWLESFIQSTQLKELRLLGALPNEQVREILSISDVYFMPSEMEGIALALYEAMAMGVAPLSADVGGQSELVLPNCGTLVKHGPGETEEYTEALYRLLSDEDLRRAMGNASRERIRDHFTLDETGRRMAALFEAAARSGKFNPHAAQMPPLGHPSASAAEPRRMGLRGSTETLLLLLSPRNFELKLKNLNLLWKVLRSRNGRSQLANLFDSSYYVSNNEDLRKHAVAPLLHYAVQGYLENRQPSPHFDPAEVERRDPRLATSRLNPLLWSILQLPN